MLTRFEFIAVAFVLSACGSTASKPGPAGPSATPDLGLSTQGSSQGQTVVSAEETPRAKGPRPPDFELDALDGDSVRLSEHLGRDVVLIDFWATYCDPCLAAMPHLNDLYRQHQAQGFVILGVSIDGPESIAAVRATVSKLGVEFPILLDDESSVVAKYNPKLSAPFSVLIGRDGSIIKKQEGYTVGKGEQLEADVARAVSGER